MTGFFYGGERRGAGGMAAGTLSNIGQLPRVSTEDRVVSVFETLACLILACLSANFLIFPSFILLFLYSTVQKSAVQYSYLFIKYKIIAVMIYIDTS